MHFEFAMGLISSCFPHAHGEDSRSTSVPPPNLEGGRAQSLVDDKRLSTNETVSHSGTETFATRVRFELCAAIALIKMKAGRRATSQSKKCFAPWRLCQSSHRPAVRVQQDALFCEQAEYFNSELAAHIPRLSRR